MVSISNLYAKNITSRSKSTLHYVPWQRSFERNIVYLGYDLHTIDHDHMNFYIVFLTTLDHVCKTILSLVIWEESNNCLFIYFNENFKKVKMATFIGVMKPHLNGTIYLKSKYRIFLRKCGKFIQFFGFEENFLAISSMTKQQNI
jgi:hypothetical protein